jgi:tRNA A37 threonylcarbamoyladenosine biosynthesis protein TsaE
MQLSYQLDEIERAARYLLDQASTSIIRIDGAMGAGKTIFIILIFTVSIIQTKPWISGWKNI